MWVKICGNTRLEDCLAAAELGADAVGFVFVPGGKRTVTVVQVAELVRGLPAGLEKIGVFMGRDADAIVAQAGAAGLTGIQLHGPLDHSVARAVRAAFPRNGRSRVVQVVHWWTDVTAEEQHEAFAVECKTVVEAGHAGALLVDSRTKTASGGTGMSFDWDAAKPALTGLSMPVIVAGGLKPENVAEAVRVLRPWGVDVASGVESAPGVKDRAAMAAFIERARYA